jgi:outer membrane protein assembly factor BamB
MRCQVRPSDRPRVAAALLACALVVPACGRTGLLDGLAWDAGPGGEGTPRAGTDAGATADAGVTREAGAIADAAPVTDVGVATDAGLGGDAGPCGRGLQAGAPWPMFGGCSTVAGWSAAVGPARPTTLWVFPANVTAEPAIAADGTIYFGTGDARLYAVSSAGALVWTFTGEAGETFASTPAVLADGTIVFGAESTTAGKLYAVSPTGTLLWSTTLSYHPDLSPPSPSVGDDGTLYVSDAYELIAVHPDGRVAWEVSAGVEYAMTPALGRDGTIYVGGQDGAQAYAPDGHRKWAVGSWGGQMSVGDDGTVYATLATGNNGSGMALIAVHPDGTEAWSDDVAGIWLRPPSTHGAVVVVDTGGGLSAEGAAGMPEWTASLGGASTGDGPVMDGSGTVYVGVATMAGPSPCGLPCEKFVGQGLHAISAGGASGWTFEVGTTFGTPAIGADGTLYVAASSETGPIGLYAIGDRH